MAVSRKDNKGRKLDTGFSQRKDGRYCYRYQLNGETKSIYDWSLPNLKEKAKKIQRDIEDGIDSCSADKMTLNECFQKYIDSKIRIRETTKMNYIYLYNKYVKDVLGDKKISKIKFSDLKKLYNDLLNNTLQFGTLTLVHNTIAPAFDLAVRDNIIRNNPTDGLLKEIRNTHDTKTDKRIAMSPREQAEFMNYARNSIVYEEYVPLFTVFLGTGLRVGECFALTWNDVDLKNGIINVNKTLTYKVRQNGKAEFHIAPTKTGAGTRTIPMLKEVKAAFVEMKKRRMEYGRCETVVDGYEDFVFYNKRKHVHKPNTINRVIISIIKGYNKQELEKAEKEKREAFQIRHFSVHNLRHTFCTNYCKLETNLKTIQGIMGHSDISITMKVYAEATEESKQESFKNLEGKFMIG